MTDDWCPENDGAYRAEVAAKERGTIETLRARIAELEEQAAIFGVERDQAEAALTEARARLAAADRMADAMRMIKDSMEMERKQGASLKRPPDKTRPNRQR